MKTGIILLFFNDEKEITENYFKVFLNNRASNFCFVNNASKDKTLDKLKEIKKFNYKNISIIDIKRNKGKNAAIKAGVRYLKNNEDFNSIVYFEFSKYRKHKNPEHLLQCIDDNKKVINIISKASNRKILKNVFSLEEIIK
ncbi:glycosyltransferase [Polaribacter aquimarinus]|uniref:Glycosyltransferase 2-like domain-containing protein n=1 Tax=Polaribacter aquimarinus TaxID=2100726 RepID=A0A2U2JEN8_9FLAO|nr:glycosyltransferase [Polaribacter aquimarinus]PWG06796.1 hypothetical protein DIS07_02870 [Polaribacter aquimarinus]